MRLLDKTTDTDYHEFDQINKEFMTNLGKRKELTGLFTFFSANYPQYELEIDNNLAMQKRCVYWKSNGEPEYINWKYV